MQVLFEEDSLCLAMKGLRTTAAPLVLPGCRFQISFPRAFSVDLRPGSLRTMKISNWTMKIESIYRYAHLVNHSPGIRLDTSAVSFMDF
jgi:hypothetical protein